MKSILLSFTPDWFERLEAGNLKFEYRKIFPQEETMVYFYVSSPVKAITGIAHFGKPEMLSEWSKKFSDRSETVKLRIADYMTDCRFAMPIYSFQKTSRIPLAQLQGDLPRFIVPRMYYYIDNSSLLEYLKEHLICCDTPFINSFDFIDDEDICN